MGHLTSKGPEVVMMYGNSSKEDLGFDGVGAWYGGLKIWTADFKELESRGNSAATLSTFHGATLQELLKPDERPKKYYQSCYFK